MQQSYTNEGNPFLSLDFFSFDRIMGISHSLSMINGNTISGSKSTSGLGTSGEWHTLINTLVNVRDTSLDSKILVLITNPGFGCKVILSCSSTNDITKEDS